MELNVADAISIASTNTTVWSRLLELGVIGGLVYGVYRAITAYMLVIDERHRTNEMRLNRLEDTLKHEQDEKDRCLVELREASLSIRELSTKIEKCWEAKNG